MGIRGLQSFIEQQCPDAVRYVSIQQLADDHKNQFHCSPVLVVDASSLFYVLYMGKSLDWIYGGQWLQYLKELENFILQFQKIGVEPVFFIGGAVAANKKTEWVKRRVDKLRDIAKIFCSIRSHARVNDRLSVWPTGAVTLTMFAIQELGAKIYQTDRDADCVIAEYALTHPEVFAILSQDTDFIIYNTKPYLSGKKLDLYTMRTVLYDRNCFAAQYLNLRMEQLPLFACLMGNDFVTLAKLKPFHSRLSCTSRVHFNLIWERVCCMIRSRRWMGDFRDVEELSAISQAVFGDTNMADLIQEGLKSYQLDGNFVPFPFCVQVTPAMQKEVYDRHLKCVNAPFVYNLLCNLSYGSSEVLEDGSIKPAALVYREIRQRCYGVLFNCFVTPGPGLRPILTESGSNIVVKEWCAYVGNDMRQPEEVKPLPLETFPSSLNEGQVPQLEDVWFTFSTMEKLQLFWSILQIPLEFETLMSIPEHLKVLACVLSYLIGGLKSGSLLQPLDVAVFVAMPLVLAKKSIKDLHLLQAPTVDAVAVNLCTLFMRGVITILNVIATCGPPFDVKYAMPWKFFDGKLFHSLYNLMKYKTSVRKLCENQNDTVDGFYSLLHAVVRHTEYDPVIFNWKTIFSDFEPRKGF